MLYAILLPSGEVKSYNSHEIPILYMLTVSEREHIVRLHEEMMKKKSQNTAINMSADKSVRPEFMDPVKAALLQNKLWDALQKQTRFKAYISERYGEIGDIDTQATIVKPSGG